MSDSAVVLFDFGGTLDADGVHWAPRFYAAYRAGGGAAEYPAFERVFTASDRALERLPRIRTLGFRGLIEAQARLLRDALPDGAGVDAGQMAARFHADAVAVVNRNRLVLERLGRRHRLGVVSNFTGNLEPCLTELDLRRCFAVVADSAVVGVAKPDTRIFADVLAQLGAPAEGAWMVGDNFETDIRPAAGLGMRTCWLAPLDRPVPAEAVTPVRIARLPDVEAVLGACTG